MNRKKTALEVVAENVDLLKERRGLSAEVLAKRSGVSPSMLRKLRHGGNISIERVEALAQVLGVQARDLLSPTLAQELEAGANAGHMVSVYAATSDLGRDTIKQALHVAEQLAVYEVGNQQDSN